MIQKLLTLIVVVLSATGVHSQSILDNFEDVRLTDYGFVNGEFFEYTPNPDNSGINASPNCAKYVRNPVEQYDVLIVETGILTDVTDYVSGAKSMQMDVYSPAPGITVQITMEDTTTSTAVNYPVGRHSEHTAVTTTSGEWETLTFSLSNQPDPTVPNTAVNRLVILFNPGSFTADTYYWDNFNTPELADDPCDGVTPDPLILEDYECNHNFYIDFSHGRMNRIPNPDMSGNTSDHVLQYGRDGGIEDDVIIGIFNAPLDLSVNNQFKMQVWDTDAPSIYSVSIQDAAGTELLVLSDSTDTDNTWEDLSYDLSSISSATNAERFVLLYEPGQLVADITYLDNIRLESGGVGIEDVNAAISNLTVYPNPVSGVASISFDVEHQMTVGIAIYDVYGREVDRLEDGIANGHQKWNWDSKGIPAGNYFAVLQSEGHIITTEMLIVTD